MLAVAILSTLYAGGQTLRQVYELRTRKPLLQQRTSAFLNFFGDQVGLSFFFSTYCLIYTSLIVHVMLKGRQVLRMHDMHVAEVFHDLVNDLPFQETIWSAESCARH